MNNNTTKKTAYQQLLEKLDDSDFAFQFKQEKQKEIEELIAQILMVTSGVSHASSSKGAQEGGHENLFKIFDILMIRHKNFSIPDLLENLQHFLFSWTMKHSEAYREWSDPLECKATISNESADEAQETENDTTADAPLAENPTDKFASEVMNNPVLSSLKNALADKFAGGNGK